MEPVIEKLKKAAQRVTLTPKEKEGMRAMLQERMRIYPARNANLAGLSSWSDILSLKINFISTVMPIVLILALLLGGGTSALAERALPGDLLYPVKLDVNEKVADLFAITPKAQAQFDATIAERRLQEAEQLAAQSRLSTATQAQLATNFQDYANKFQSQANASSTALSSQDVLALNSDFEAALTAHQRILAGIGGARTGDVAHAVNQLVSVVGTEQTDTQASLSDSETHVKTETGADVKVAAQNKGNEAQNKIDEVQSFINQKSAVLGSDAVAKAQVRLHAADDEMASGTAQFDGGAYGDAFVSYQQAQNIAQESKILLQGRVDYEHESEGDSEGGHVQSNASSTTNISPSANASTSQQYRVNVHGGDDNGQEGRGNGQENGHEGDGTLQINGQGSVNQGNAQNGVNINLDL